MPSRPVRFKKLKRKTRYSSPFFPWCDQLHSDEMRAGFKLGGLSSARHRSNSIRAHSRPNLRSCGNNTTLLGVATNRTGFTGSSRPPGYRYPSEREESYSRLVARLNRAAAAMNMTPVAFLRRYGSTPTNTPTPRPPGYNAREAALARWRKNTPAKLDC